MKKTLVGLLAGLLTLTAFSCSLSSSSNQNPAFREGQEDKYRPRAAEWKDGSKLFKIVNVVDAYNMSKVQKNHPLYGKKYFVKDLEDLRSLMLNEIGAYHSTRFDELLNDRWKHSTPGGFHIFANPDPENLLDYRGLPIEGFTFSYTLTDVK